MQKTTHNSYNTAVAFGTMSNERPTTHHIATITHNWHPSRSC